MIMECGGKLIVMFPSDALHPVKVGDTSTCPHCKKVYKIVEVQ